ncbi:MAG: DNA-3-methyladenine glycosylase 2 family protein [Actinomycetota bacterium]
MPLTHRAASQELARRDKVMKVLVERHGLMKIGAAPPASKRFESLANAIASQQLNGRAATSIWARVKGLIDGPFTAEAVRTVPVTQLREAGLSGAKCASLLDLADQVADGRVRLDRIGRLTDDEVVGHLVGVRGIGPWTAQMFLMFTLRRLDVWPAGDYGVRSGYGRAFNGGVMPSAREIAPLGDRFAPYRSVAAWYCWAAADDPEYR